MPMTDAVRRVPRAFLRKLAVAGLSLAAVAGDVSTAQAQPDELPQIFSDPALANYRLTTGNLAKFVRATNALKALEDEDIDLEDRFEMDDEEDLDLGRMAAAFDSEPRVKNAINSAGMTSRDYLTFMFSMIQAMFGSVMVQMGGEEALEDLPAGALKDNIAFFLEHQDEFEALDMGGDGDDDN